MKKVFGEIRRSKRSQPLNGISNLGSVTPRPWEPTPMFLTSDAIEKQLSWQPTTIRRGLLEMLNSLQASCLKRAWQPTTIRRGLLEMLNSLQASCLKRALDRFTERGDNLMSWITLQTRTGPEEYQVSDLDEVVWWKTENAITAVGYMDVVSGRMTQNDLETCRIKRPEIVREILQQQASLKPRDHRDQSGC